VNKNGQSGLPISAFDSTSMTIPAQDFYSKLDQTQQAVVAPKPGAAETSSKDTRGNPNERSQC
jgi:hypothetical protein